MTIKGKGWGEEEIVLKIFILNIQIFCFQYGERGSGFRPQGEVQDFQKIRDQCLQNGVLFEDPVFPAEDSSIYFSRSCPGSLRWKRPSVR